MKNLFPLLVCLFFLTGCWGLWIQQSGVQQLGTQQPGTEQESKTKTIWSSDTSQVCFQDTCFQLEVADADEERKRGLMFREYLGDDAWMLFIFDDMRKRRKFRMKNTKIPLDMIWLDDKGKIVFIEKDVQPCRKDPCQNYGPDDIASKYVVELNAGEIDKIGSAIWDEIVIQ